MFLVRNSLRTARYLTIILNKSLKSGSVPSSCKNGKIVPLHKSGDTQVLSNYMAISLTPHSGKLFEHNIYKPIIEFFEFTNLCVITNTDLGVVVVPLPS